MPQPQNWRNSSAIHSIFGTNSDRRAISISIRHSCDNLSSHTILHARRCSSGIPSGCGAFATASSRATIRSAALHAGHGFSRFLSGQARLRTESPRLDLRSPLSLLNKPLLGSEVPPHLVAFSELFQRPRELA